MATEHERTAWPDERIDERVTAIDQRFEHTDAVLTALQQDVRAMRTELSQLKDRLIQIGFALVGVHITGTTALVIIAID